MQALKLLQLTKKYVSRWSNIEIKPIAMVIIELRSHDRAMLAWTHQPASQQKFLKFHINLLEGFMVKLKMFLSLAMPK